MSGYQSPFTAAEIDDYLTRASTSLQASDVDDVPVNNATTVPVSSNWAYDHVAGLEAHKFLQSGANAVQRTVLAKLRDVVNVRDFATTKDALTYAAANGKTVVFDTDATVNIPTDVPTLQNALDLIAPTPNVTITLMLAAGHQPATGVALSDGDWSQFVIASADAKVTLSASFTTSNEDNEFIRAIRARTPKINTLFDIDSKADRGMQCVDYCHFFVNPGCGFKNAKVHNLEVRSSYGVAVGGVFTGAGDTGLRIQRKSDVRASTAVCDDCGTIGIDVSRGSMAEVQGASCQRCGLTKWAKDPDYINMGGLCVRRSWAVADQTEVDDVYRSLNCSGSARGISAQLGSHVIASTADLSDCKVTAVRATSSSYILLNNSDLSGTVSTLAVDAGEDSTICVQSCTFGGGKVSVFGSGAIVDVSGSTDWTSVDKAVNTFDPNGYIIDENAYHVAVAPAFNSYVFELADDTATYYQPLGSGGGRMSVILVSAEGSQTQGIYALRTTNVAPNGLGAGSTLVGCANVELINEDVELTGTMGTDGKINLAASSTGGGRIYIENRRGAATTVYVTVLSQTLG